MDRNAIKRTIVAVAAVGVALLCARQAQATPDAVQAAIDRALTNAQAQISTVSNAYIAADIVITNDYRTRDTTISNAFVAADVVITNWTDAEFVHTNDVRTTIWTNTIFRYYVNESNYIAEVYGSTQRVVYCAVNGEITTNTTNLK